MQINSFHSKAVKALAKDAMNSQKTQVLGAIQSQLEQKQEMKFSELLEAEGIKQREAPTAEDATSLFMSLLIQSQMEAISLEQDTEGLKEGKFS